jgi:hypothetical protein
MTTLTNDPNPSQGKTRRKRVKTRKTLLSAFEKSLKSNASLNASIQKALEV